MPLGFERLFINPEGGHSIGLKPERQRKILRRERLVVLSRIFGGKRVPGPADTRNQRQVRIGEHVLGPLEHHVFEEMSESGPAGALIL